MSAEEEPVVLMTRSRRLCYVEKREGGGLSIVNRSRAELPYAVEVAVKPYPMEYVALQFQKFYGTE